MDKSQYTFTELSTDINSQQEQSQDGTFAFRNQIPNNAAGTQVRLYWARSLTCIFLPLFITAYYAGLWAFWIKGYDDGGPVPYGPTGGRWAYYTWFVVSAVGIGMSKYALAGIEAAMLMDKRWAPRNAMQLIAHSDKTWSGPAGWVFTRTRPSPAWVVLFTVSLMPYLALPLSGFTLELTSGYSSSASEEVGRNYGQTKASLLDQNLDEVFTRTFNRFRAPAPSVLYGRSAYYVPADNASVPLDRSWLQRYPNDWPDDDVTVVFIAPQSDDIVSGQTWGLESRVNCTVVDSIDQFHLLSQRNKDNTGPRCPPINFNSSDEQPEYIGLPDLCDFDVYALHQPDSETLLPMSILNQAYFPVGEMEVAVKYNKSGYDEDAFSDLQAVTIEVALFQNEIKLVEEQCPRLSRQVSNFLGTTVRGMKRDFRLNNVSSQLTGQTDQSLKQLPAIGVKCTSSFRTGSATIDGPSGTYASFTHEPADNLVSATPVPLPTAIPRIFRSEVSAALDLQDMWSFQALESAVDILPVDWNSGSNMDLNPMAYIASNVSWLSNIYKSADSFIHSPLYCDDNDATSTSTWQQLVLLTSEGLRLSLVRAHKAYAIEMMRPGLQPYLVSDTLYRVNPTSIISPGKVPPLVVLILLAVWAIGSSTLGMVFGMRPRWSETLDGFSMFRFGTDNPGLSSSEAAYVKHYSECEALKRVPGLVRASGSTRHVTLVRRHGGQGEG